MNPLRQTTMQPDYDISVIVCTYNRARMLNDTLASWADVDQTAISAELIVVDNNSSDGTSNVCAEFGDSHKLDVKYVYESTPGLSFARNRGIQESAGRIIAFIDDDVYLDRYWLKEIMSVFSNQSHIHCAGGNSIPVFDGSRPDWLDDKLLRIYGSTLSGDVEKEMRYPEHPFGVNMAFRREVFEQVGLFNTRLGRIKKSLLSNEEKELFFRIDEFGLKTHYTPKAIIYHRVPAERLKKDWIIRRHFGQGLSKVAFDQISHKSRRIDLFRDAVVHLKRAVIGTKPFAIRRTIFFFNRQTVAERAKCAMFLGMAKQSFAEIFQLS
jgi:glycosyltransferase involved in cell wall biosynthesis